MLVLINGLPHFSKIMTEDLNEFDEGTKYVFLNTYESKWAQLKFLFLLPFCTAVISFNGVSDKSKSLDWVMRFKKKLIMQWQGTDVDLAVKRQKERTINRKYIDYSIHLISSSWFEQELKEVIDSCTFAPFSYVKQAGNDSKYKNISIFSYIAKGREKFYGWDELISLAKSKPNIKVTVAGTTGEGLDYPENVKCLGWVNEVEFQNQLMKNAIFVRLTEHDGKSISVAQALSKGCEVIWTYEFDKCYIIPKKTEALQRQVEELIDIVKKRGLIPNMENIRFAENNLLRKSVMNTYCKTLNSTLNG